MSLSDLPPELIAESMKYISEYPKYKGYTKGIDEAYEKYKNVFKSKQYLEKEYLGYNKTILHTMYHMQRAILKSNKKNNRYEDILVMINTKPMYTNQEKGEWKYSFVSDDERKDHIAMYAMMIFYTYNLDDLMYYVYDKYKLHRYLDTKKHRINNTLVPQNYPRVKIFTILDRINGFVSKYIGIAIPEIGYMRLEDDADIWYGELDIDIHIQKDDRIPYNNIIAKLLNENKETIEFGVLLHEMESLLYTNDILKPSYIHDIKSLLEYVYSVDETKINIDFVYVNITLYKLFHQYMNVLDTATSSMVKDDELTRVYSE